MGLRSAIQEPEGGDRPVVQRGLRGSLWSLAAAVCVFVFVVRVQPGGAHLARAFDDLAQLFAAALAALGCARRARRTSGRSGWSWRLLAAATGSWALGEAAWSYYEVLAGRETPFPSVADAGYLLFPVMAAIGLFLWPTGGLAGSARWRALLDGVLVAGSLFIISWTTALGAAIDGGGGSHLAYAVSLAYPISDLILLTVTVVVVSYAGRAARTELALIAAGLICFILADSGFAYLTAIGKYATGNPVDIGWFAGLLLLAAASLVTSRAESPAPAREASLSIETQTAALLPYLPAVTGLAVAVGRDIAGHRDEVTLAAATLVIGVLLLRQLLAVIENRALVEQLFTAQDQLRYQAYHDPLTGLANRALFTDRLNHGLQLHKRDHRPLSLIYCDLDGFKLVNDTLGHDAGDSVLKAVAERLRALTRPGDTVARFGGDEFGILLEDGSDAPAVAGRVINALAHPVEIGHQSVSIGISIGLAGLNLTDSPLLASEFIQRADTAMYHAKRTGKNRSVTWTPGLAEDLSIQDLDVPADPLVDIVH